MTASLRALLSSSIDYAGMFPPASLDAAGAVKCWRAYQKHEQAWLLRRFVVPANRLSEVPFDLDARLSVICEHDHVRADALEGKRVFSAEKPTYCEVALDLLADVKAARSFAKLRTGGIEPHATPSIESVCEYLLACRRFEVALKATAGLHHAIRGKHPLTAVPDAQHAVQHGFLNLFLAAAFLFAGQPESGLDVLAETEADAFTFSNEHASHRGRRISTNEIIESRKHFLHSFGSCSFTEPVAELKALGWL